MINLVEHINYFLCLYHFLLKDTLPTILSTFRPDLVIYDAGVDPHYEDDLGKLGLTDEGKNQFLIC